MSDNPRPYVLKQITRDGLWTSMALSGTDREIHQAVVAGWLSGEPRWAIDLDSGRFLCGLSGKGELLRDAPAVPSALRGLNWKGRLSAE